jgi:hypothetical protein
MVFSLKESNEKAQQWETSWRRLIADRATEK